MMMSLGPYASFIVTSYAAAALVIVILIGWIVLDYRNQTRRLHELDRSGVTRRSGRSAMDAS
ncbi:heme exporter protein CcmD [Bradyrhizobium sp. CB1717]|uniref:heme exporter protein CcmD n=1 Tax=Bradyrhizobium sp. CB1717 TaxID=3039154 RepID=UPI0024B155AF|nr:heme exporter protein CcmD [Bradyrhizobium sp. CB1717]WFU25058.1 heme exporter protein CcmD [Bradyrhizobium sp. CB1717]